MNITLFNRLFVLAILVAIVSTVLGLFVPRFHWGMLDGFVMILGGAFWKVRLNKMRTVETNATRD